MSSFPPQGSGGGGTDTRVACKLMLDANQSISNNTTTTITFDTGAHELIDTHGFHEGTTNPGRITIPTGQDGLYLVVAYAYWDSNTTGYRQTNLAAYNSGGTSLDSNVETNDAASTNAAQHNTMIVSLVAGDYLLMSVFQSSGGAINAQGGSATNAGITQFSAVRLSA